ncbi:type II toxin-antitoxin system PemK/MazF family toxin [Microcoleus sp. bin48.metabat.b7b8b9.023]|uniref:type II toxin-antitoxin system PemK/MazF family toxin n=1 Tax=unclassified Microcoleus TaxID=2642155 RepID=UPI0034553FE6
MRPAVIISGTAFNQRRKVTVLPITSAVPDEGLRTVILPVIASTLNGLNSERFIVCVDPMTFKKRRLVRCIWAIGFATNIRN